MKSFYVGAAVGILLGFVAAGLLGAQAIHDKVSEVRHGWVLKPVLVASRDLAAGEKLTFADLSQRNLPAQFVTDSVVAPLDVQMVVGQTLTIPAKAGELVLWGDFIDHAARDRIVACAVDGLASFRAAVSQTKAEQVRAFSARAPDPAVSPVPPLAADGAGLTAVVILAKPVDEGVAIPRSAVVIGKLPRSMVTDALVPADALDEVVGARALVSMQPGDPLRWQFLDDAARPGSAVSCRQQVLAALEKAEAETARTLAQSFFDRAEKK